jgi:hypothetical protein
MNLILINSVCWSLTWVKSNSHARQNKIIYLPNVEQRLTGAHVCNLTWMSWPELAWCRVNGPHGHTYFKFEIRGNLVRTHHMPQPAYNNLCWPQVESDEARRHLYFHWSVNFYFYLWEALFAAPSFLNLTFLKIINWYYSVLKTRHY